MVVQIRVRTVEVPGPAEQVGRQVRAQEQRIQPEDRLIQKPRKLPLRSNEAGMMYPLTAKKRNTPVSPALTQFLVASRIPGITK